MIDSAPDMHDQLGALLRAFYASFGAPGEGPPLGIDVTTMLGMATPLESELAPLRDVLANETAQRDIQTCREHLGAIWPTVTSDAFLREVSGDVLVRDDEFEMLSSGVFWFSLAESLDRRDASGLPLSSVPGLEVPLPVRIRWWCDGSSTVAANAARRNCLAVSGVRHTCARNGQVSWPKYPSGTGSPAIP